MYVCVCAVHIVQKRMARCPQKTLTIVYLICRYIDDFWKEEGISLDYTKIRKNEGLRCLTKLCLNSLWVNCNPVILIVLI